VQAAEKLDLEYYILGTIDSAMEESFKAMGKLTYEESNWPKYTSYDPDKMISVAHRYASESNKCLICATDHGTPIGVFAGHLIQPYYSDDLLARDLLWYVYPEYRKTGVGLQMFMMFESWAKVNGATAIMMSQDSSVDMTRFNRVLERKGYDFIGSNYCVGVER
jgi:hypothetical protein